MDLDPKHFWHSTLNGLERAGKALMGLPGAALDTGERAASKILPDYLVAHAHLPGYGHLSHDDLTRAEARSVGLTHPTQMIRDKVGSRHEPISLEVTGTLGQLEARLKATGWVRSEKMTAWQSFKATVSLLDRVSGLSHVFDFRDAKTPMSTMYLDGQAMVAGYEKNNDHDRGRDHLRIFRTGRQAPDGTPIYAIAATRDVALNTTLPKFSQGHRVDPVIDRERDMVMADLLRAGPLDWQVAKGQLPAGEQQAVNSAYRTDGKVYLARLNLPAGSQPG